MSTQRRAWLILTVILVVELVPFTLAFALSPPGVIGRLYGFNGPWVAFVAAFAVTIAYVTHAARTFPLIRRNFLTFSSMKALAIAFAIVTGTVEELYFRKFLMDWAALHGAGAVGQIAVSGFVFGAAHGIWGIFAKQWRMAIGAAAATGVLGLLLAVVYLAAARHVAPCVWAHVLINLAIEPWLILAAVARSHSSPHAQLV